MNFNAPKKIIPLFFTFILVTLILFIHSCGAPEKQTRNSDNGSSDLTISSNRYIASIYAGYTKAGGSVYTSGSADGSGTNAGFWNVSGLQMDSTGNLYASDRSNNEIRQIDTSQIVTTYLSTADPIGLVIDSSNNNLYIASCNNNSISKINLSSQTISIYAGSSNGYANGTGTNAKFNCPVDLTIDANNNIYVTDYGNAAIRKIDTNLVVSLYAGVPTSSGYVDGAATSAKFYKPHGIIIDKNNNLFISDQEKLIRKITFDQVVSTIAGMTTIGLSDGFQTSAKFKAPAGIKIDSNNNLFITDFYNNKIRKMSPQGLVTTLLINDPGSIITSPRSITIDNLTGNLYVGTNYGIAKLVPY